MEHRFSTSKTLPRRFELVSSGQKRRKFFAGFAVEIAHQLAELARRLARRRPGRGHVHRVLAEVRQIERHGDLAAVGARVRPHPPFAAWRQRRQFGDERAAIVEELLGLVAPHPALEDLEVLAVRAHVGDRDLVRAERPLDGEPVDDLRARPPLRRAKHDGRPRRALRDPAPAGFGLNRPDAREARVERGGDRRVHVRRIAPLDEVHLVAVRLEELADVVVRVAAHHRGSGDLVSVEVQDRQNRAVARRVQEVDALPRPLERPGLRLAVAHDRHGDEVGVVEDRAERVDEHVPELAALVDGARRGRAHVTRDRRRAWRTGGRGGADPPRPSTPSDRSPSRSPRGIRSPPPRVRRGPGPRGRARSRPARR